MRYGNLNRARSHPSTFAKQPSAPAWRSSPDTRASTSPTARRCASEQHSRSSIKSLTRSCRSLKADVSPDTRFCVEWFKQYGFDQGPFGTAETLSKGIDTSIDGLVRAGVVKSAAGKVKLLSVREIPDFYDPEADDRTSEWEICLHLAKALQDRGTDDAARLMAAARRVPSVDLDDVKELAYLLYSIAEKKGWAETALLFNNMGTLWTDLEKLAQTAGAETGGQGEFTAGLRER